MDHEKRGYTSLPDYTASATHSPPAKAGGSLSLRDRMELKLKALSCHKSQHADFRLVKGWVTKRAQDLGKKAHTKFAECFVRIAIGR